MIPRHSSTSCTRSRASPYRPPPPVFGSSGPVLPRRLNRRQNRTELNSTLKKGSEGDDNNKGCPRQHCRTGAQEMNGAKACASLAACLCLWASAGWADVRLEEAIPAQPVAAALAEFAHATGLQLIYVSDVLQKQQSKGARAGLSGTEALAELLEGTGLTFEF